MTGKTKKKLGLFLMIYPIPTLIFALIANIIYSMIMGVDLASGVDPATASTTAGSIGLLIVNLILVVLALLGAAGIPIGIPLGIYFFVKGKKESKTF